MSKKSKPAERRKQGVPSKFNDALAEVIYEMAKQGATEEKMAEVCGVTARTFYTWKMQHKDFLLALQACKNLADEMVVSALYQRAIGYTHPEEKIFCTKEGMIVRAETEKHYPPDPTSAQFWLTNRKRADWKHRTENVNENLNTDMTFESSWGGTPPTKPDADGEN